MTQVAQGEQVTLLVEWLEYPGGPPADVTGLTITIADPDATVVVGPTSTGIQHPATGVYTYLWTVAGGADLGDYTVIWHATDAQSEAVSAAEVVTVVAGASTDVGMIRLLIPDTSADPDRRLFADDQLQSFLDLELSVRRAAAQALEVIASSEVMVSKVIRTRDGLTTDGAKVSDALLKRAAQLRKQADDAGEPGGVDTYFEIEDLGWTRAELAEAPIVWL